MIIKVGTRASKLAKIQTQIATNSLKSIHPEIVFEVCEIVTSGDKILDVALDKIGGKGLFLKEIEDALLKREIDIAIHSMKDVPARLPSGLVIASVLEREDNRDCLISTKFEDLNSLPAGSVIGTSSARRRVQLELKRPDLEYKILRGNVLTRIKKVEDGQYDAAIMAYAGIRRLSLSHMVKEVYEQDYIVPAIAQGAICIECRSDDNKIIEVLRSINHRDTEITTATERAFLREINGDCSTPIGAYATLSSTGEILLNAWYGGYNAEFEHKYSVSGTNSDELGKLAAENFKRILNS